MSSKAGWAIFCLLAFIALLVGLNNGMLVSSTTGRVQFGVVNAETKICSYLSLSGIKKRYNTDNREQGCSLFYDGR